jgi:hypothetical protein
LAPELNMTRFVDTSTNLRWLASVSCLAAALVHGQRGVFEVASEGELRAALRDRRRNIVLTQHLDLREAQPLLIPPTLLSLQVRA